jgi:hypothetical protein
VFCFSHSEGDWLCLAKIHRQQFAKQTSTGVASSGAQFGRASFQRDVLPGLCSRFLSFELAGKATATGAVNLQKHTARRTASDEKIWQCPSVLSLRHGDIVTCGFFCSCLNKRRGRKAGKSSNSEHSQTLHRLVRFRG